MCTTDFVTYQYSMPRPSAENKQVLNLPGFAKRVKGSNQIGKLINQDVNISQSYKDFGNIFT